MSKHLRVERVGGKIMSIGGKSLAEIARDIGVDKAEVSMAVNAKRLFRRKKLNDVVEAGYPLELFVFGADWYERRYGLKR